MYTDFFGLTEIPFSIAPNPHYLYLSERHKEALAHLTYGLGTTGGFVLLTGEVGTGKTTVTRSIMEDLPENTQAAFILNPTLSSQELLATICDEFAIFYSKKDATLKTLTDKIQEKLLDNHHHGINTLLIIDEAQHLKAEVLEQLRLLTNLETHTKKLLQVILIGQPELQTLLKRQDLRQLAQRITARYHLLPLSKKDVIDYIEHRLMVAGCQQRIFTHSAMTTIHQLSKGIPRLINLLCDRALLGAYGKNSLTVSRKMVLVASQEALGEEYQLTFIEKSLTVKVLVFVLLAALLVGYFLPDALRGISAMPGQENATHDVLQPTKASEQSAALLTEPLISEPVVEQPLIETTPVEIIGKTLPQAVVGLLAKWQIESDLEITEPCQQIAQYLLSCYWFKGNLSTFKHYNYPAIFKFFSAKGEAFYGVLKAISSQGLTFEFDEQIQTVDRQWLDKHWQGASLIFWQPPVDDYSQLVVNINEHSDLTSIQWLENKLSGVQNRPARQLSYFDAMLINHLQQFQRKHAISSENFANTRTLMALTNTVSQGFPVYSQD